MSDILSISGIFCEQVRHEIGGTETFVGVTKNRRTYRTPAPFLIRELSAVVWVVHAMDAPETEIEVWLDVVGLGNLGVVKVQTKPASADPETTSSKARPRTLRLILSFGRIVVPQEGAIVLIARFNGQEQEVCWLNLRQTTSKPGAAQDAERVATLGTLVRRKKRGDPPPPSS